MKPIRAWLTRTAARTHDHAADRGVTSIEYAGIVILVAGIIIAIRALGLDTTIANAVNGWVSAIVGGG
jgi:Flp pilus assembly pilin Flp